MTFRDAVRALDAEGEQAAKRPSMTGYAYKRRAAAAASGGEDGGQIATEVVLIAKDGSEDVMTLASDGRAIEAVADVLMLTAEKANALIFATDWDLAPRADLEIVRTGGREM